MFTLSPQGRAVAAITLAFMLLTGSLDRIAYTLASLLGDSFPDGRPGALLLSALIGLVAVVVLALGLNAANTQEGWGAALAQGAVALAMVELLIVAISVLAILIQGEEAFGAAYLGGFFGMSNMFG